jgi:hypothetical protein
MTKNPRDERVWTNSEVQEDAQGYLAAQIKRRQDEEAEQQKRRDADDKARFVEEFIAEGGNQADAAAVWKEIRNERATDAVRRAEEAAGEQARRRISQIL